MRKIMLLLGIGILLVVSGCGCESSTIQLRQKSFKVEVGEKLNKKTETYFNGNADKIKINFSKVNIKKLGRYEVTAKNDQKKWKFKIVVVDTKAPTLKVSKKEYVFKLGEADVNKVKSEVLSNIVVKDNYDKNIDTELLFNNFTLPESEKRIDMPIVVKDSSGNESKKVVISLLFTKDGKKKENLKKETIKSNIQIGDVNKSVAVNNGSSSGNNGSKPSGNGSGDSQSKPNTGGSDKPNTDGGNSGSKPDTGGTDKPNTGGGNDNTTPPVIPPVPDRVQTTCANFKEQPHYLGNTKMCFSTLDEAEAWARSQRFDPNSPWYGYRFDFAGISNYPDWQEGDPWTANANHKDF